MAEDKKIVYNRFDSILKELGWKHNYDVNTFPGMSKQITLKCPKCDHDYTTYGTQIVTRRLNYCAKCSRKNINRKYDIAYIQNHCDEKNIKLSSRETYRINSKEFVDAQCQSCSAIIQFTIAGILNKNSVRCKKCYHKDRLKESKFCEVMTQCYDCGKEVKRKMLLENQNPVRCKSCAIKFNNVSKKKLPYVTTKKIIEQNNCKLITLEKEYMTRHHDVEIECGKCKNRFWQTPANYLKSKKFQCPSCSFSDTYMVSNAEKEIKEFIESNNLDVETSKRGIFASIHHNSEIDIFIPEKNLGIEFDGLYYHSTRFKDKNYHNNKTNEAKKTHMTLLHIFEDEWRDKKEIIKSILKSKLNINDRKIHARKCEIKIIEAKRANKFLNDNHIQGEDRSGIRIGLLLEGELVCLLTVAKSRFNKSAEYEIVRFCNTLNTSVIGGFARLLKYFEKTYNPKNIITYADRRFSHGNLYANNGFKFSHVSKPNYWYVINGRRESRHMWQKHKMQTRLKKFDENKSEVQNMLDNGYYQIFDCGNYVFLKNI